MQVIRPKTAGFCPGVQFAEMSLNQLLKDRPGTRVHTTGDLVHNRHTLLEWKNRGIASFGEGEEPEAGSLVAVRTHGIDRRTEEKFRKYFELLDLTCSKVKNLQNYIDYYSGNGYYIVIAGDKKHPEVQGLTSYAADCTVIGNEGELEKFLEDCRTRSGTVAGKSYCKIMVVSQTAGSHSFFEKTARAIQSACGLGCEVRIFDSACAFIVLREEECLELQKNADVTFVVGDRISANTLTLYETLKAKKPNTWLVAGLEDLLKQNIDLGECRMALVVATSSTPASVEKEVTDYLAMV